MIKIKKTLENLMMYINFSNVYSCIRVWKLQKSKTLIKKKCIRSITDQVTYKIFLRRKEKYT